MINSYTLDWLSKYLITIDESFETDNNNENANQLEKNVLICCEIWRYNKKKKKKG